MTPEQFFNLALLLVAVSLGILIAAIVYNSKSKETLREAKDISNKAKSEIETMEAKNAFLRQNITAMEDNLSEAKRERDKAEAEAETLQSNLHALGEEIVNPELPPTFRIEENEEIVRVMADYTSLNFDKKIPLIVREFEKADNLSLAWAKANKLLTALKK